MVRSLLFCLFFSSSVFAIDVGAQRTSLYLPILKNKNIALVVNQTSRVQKKHLIDFLLEQNISIKKLFALEHGIRGNHDAGEDIQNGIDVKTGLSVFSLYGKNKAPTAQSLKDVDIILFDIQDVGVRFYTYISSLYYVLDACGKYQKLCIVLDRPNPNADTVAGPVLDLKFKSFLGMYPIPIIYGLTIGELAKMIVGEKWVKNSPELKVINVSGWKRNQQYGLPIKPSPNLPTFNSIKWYPTLALFEPTVMSIGRGTHHPFEAIGYPNSKFGTFKFMPKSIDGMSKYPKHQDKWCYGELLKGKKPPSFSLKYFIKYFNIYKGDDFVKHQSFFTKLIGNDRIFSLIKARKSIEEIENSWQKELNDYKRLREKYLIYR